MSGVNESLIVNELLAFLQQKLDVMDELSAIQICSSNFSLSEICSAKEVLYRSLKISGAFIPHRRGDEQGKKTLQDIIKVLKETDPDDVPSFVARELAKLPPVTFDHVDVTSLLKDIVSLKKSLAEIQMKFEASQNTIAELRSEVSLLRSTAAVSRSADASNYIDALRGALDKTPTSRSVSAISSPPAPVQLEPPPAPAAAAVRACPQPPPRAPVPAILPQAVRESRGNVTAAAHRRRRPASKTPAKPEAQSTSKEPPRAKVDEEGFTLVQKKRKARRQPCRSQCGTAAPEEDSVLRAATPNVALYVSRLHHSVTAKDVTEYVRQKSGYSLRVFPLESRHYVHFTSYVVRVPKPLLQTIGSADFWPKDVVFRRFRGTMPSHATSPVLSS